MCDVVIVGVRGSPAQGYFPPALVEGGGARLGILPTAVTAAAVGAQRGLAKNGVLRETGLEKRSRINNGTVLREILLRAIFLQFRNPKIPNM